MQDEPRKAQQANQDNADKGKVDELPPKPMNEDDAQSIKGGMGSLKYDKK